MLRLRSDETAQPGEAGRLVITPFALFRETTLLRYNTEDVVRPLAGPFDCSLRHLPATSNLLGKLRLAKGYSQTGGVAAMLLAWLAIAVVLTLPLLGIRYDTFPLMVVLGPLMVVQYAGWRKRCDVERSWLQFREQAQPQALSQYREEAPQEHSQALVP